MNNRMYKSNRNRVICGVCGGVGEYFNVDPTLIRLAMALFTIMGGSGVLLYIVAALLMPEDDGYIDV